MARIVPSSREIKPGAIRLERSGFAQGSAVAVAVRGFRQCPEAAARRRADIWREARAPCGMVNADAAHQAQPPPFWCPVIPRIRTFWWRAIASLWFLPTVSVAIAVLLAVGLVEVETYVDFPLAERWPRLFGAAPDGARGMLTAIASSVITVAGVVFSVTIVALSLAASQYSPRVLRTFTSDRPTQIVLGVFVGIYVYCLLVLRTIRSSDGLEFVPSIAVLGGLVLALVGIGFLVFFIHHMAESIQASSIASRVTLATLAAVDELFPEQLGAGAPDSERLESELNGAWVSVPAQRTGYIVHVNNGGLLTLSRQLVRVIRMRAGIGDFIIEGQALAEVNGSAELEAQWQTELNRQYSVDVQRTIEQDAAFGVQQLVDIACKALSPSMNDASTAVLCVDRLTQILVCLARRRIESPYRRDQSGQLRVIAHGPSFESLVELAYQELYRNALGTLPVIIRLLWSLEEVGAATDNPDRRRALLRHVERMAQDAQHLDVSAPERQAIYLKACALRQRFAGAVEARGSANGSELDAGPARDFVDSSGVS